MSVATVTCVNGHSRIAEVGQATRGTYLYFADANMRVYGCRTDGPSYRRGSCCYRAAIECVNALNHTSSLLTSANKAREL